MENLTTGGFPLVAQASGIQLRADGRPVFRRVESRMVLGCQSGRGTVTINGQRYPLVPSSLFLLPWGHSIGYAADPRDPFHVYGMHLIPWHRADAPVELGVAHDPRHHLAGVPWRRDMPLGGDGDVIAGTEQQRPELAALVRYAIRVGQQAIPSVEVARALGTLAIAELAKPAAPDLPAELRRLLAWIEAHLAEPLALPELARVAGRGTTTINRLFHRHLQTAPMSWVIDRRIERAGQLLSTTDRTVGQIAHDTGMGDPYYFSRLFKQRTGLPPTRWRRTWSRP